MSQNLKISQLTETTAPALTDVLPIVDSSTTKKVQVTNLIKGYTLQLQGANFNPADATTYYPESIQGGGATVSQGTNKTYILKKGTITACQLYFGNTVTGSSEVSTVSIRLNNTTDYTVSAVVTNDSAVTFFSNLAMSIPVIAGDYIEIKWLTPTWVSNPTTVKLYSVLYIE